MVVDIGQVFLGYKHYISAPEPVDGIQPMTHISFKDNSIMAPQSLEIKSHNSSGKQMSRRSQLYNESRSGGTMPLRQPSTKRFDPATESIMRDIDNSMGLRDMSDDENNIIEDDENQMHSESMMREQMTEAIQETPVEKPSTRRVINRRRVQS
jgi:hypothetical protein